MAYQTRGASIRSTFSLSTINCIGMTVFTVGCTVLLANAILTFLPYGNPELAETPRAWLLYLESALSISCSALFVFGGTIGIVYFVKASQGDDAAIGGEHNRTWPTNKDLEEASIDAESEPSDDISMCETSSTASSEKHTSPAGEGIIGSRETLHQRVLFEGHRIWSHCVQEIGFVTTTLFLGSSTIFLGAGIASVASVAQTRSIAQGIRYPQLAGGIGFAVASALIMVQAQKAWWKPAWKNLRWWIGLGNYIGSVGFIVCACLGLLEPDVYWARYQFGLSYLWGSTAFLFASGIQLYKSFRRRQMELKRSTSPAR